MQMIANILGQGSQLREYAMDVEEKLRQVELESIQVSWIFLPLLTLKLYVSDNLLQLVQNGNGVRMVQHMFASTPSQPLNWCSSLLVTLSIYWHCKLLLFLGSQVQRQLGIRMWLFWKWRSSDFCKKLSIHRLHLQIFWFYYTYRTTWRRVITWCHCMLKFEIVIPSSRIWRPYLVDFRLFSSALSPYYCKDCHWHGRCEFSFICLNYIFSIWTSVSYCSGSILI